MASPHITVAPEFPEISHFGIDRSDEWASPGLLAAYHMETAVRILFGDVAACRVLSMLGVDDRAVCSSAPCRTMARVALRHARLLQLLTHLVRQEHHQVLDRYERHSTETLATTLTELTALLQADEFAAIHFVLGQRAAWWTARSPRAARSNERLPCH